MLYLGGGVHRTLIVLVCHDMSWRGASHILHGTRYPTLFSSTRSTRANRTFGYYIDLHGDFGREQKYFVLCTRAQFSQYKVLGVLLLETEEQVQVFVGLC